MHHYHEDLPIEIDPEELPLRQIAPCWSDGQVETTDYDTKDARCECEYMICLVDRRNVIESSIRKSSR